MFITIKINRYKIIMSLVLLIIIFTVGSFGIDAIKKRNIEDVNNFTSQDINSKVIKFLGEYGWKVENNPISSESFYFPQEFNTIYKIYNQYQKDINKDLTPYRGKRVTRFTYKVLNYKLPEKYKGQQVYADVFVYNTEIIGGDLKTNQINGFMVSLKNNTFKQITGIEEWEFE